VPLLPAHVVERLGTPEREAVLRRIELLGTEADPDFDRLTRMAARALKAPLALVTLVDVDRQRFKARLGTDLSETPAAVSFCAYTVTSSPVETMVVLDAATDPRFRDLPVVIDPPHVRFYAGAPIVSFGEAIGTICVIDTEPRQSVTEAELAELADLAGVAASLFSVKDGARRGEIFKEALIREEKRHALALEAASIASWVWDVRSGMLECDPLLPELFGLPPATRFPAIDIYRAIDPRDVRRTEMRLREAMASGDDYSEEYRIRNTHPTRWLAGRGRVVERDEEGEPVLVFGVNFDITGQKSAEEHQRLLLRELNHRVKNTLATVQALATQTVRHSRKPEEFLKAFSGRLHAIGMAHGLLSDYEWRGIGLSELIRLQVMPYVADEMNRIRVEGGDAFLSPDQALALGLVLHELASNAVKYGALSVPQGEVLLNWRIVEATAAPGAKPARRMTLNWIERGGPPVSSPDRRGFGSILIERSLGKLLSSRVTHEFRETGVAAEISFVLEEEEGAEALPLAGAAGA
jgi:two-component sensor histidine kinase